MAYTHIGREDWSVIARMLRAGYAGAEIARTLGKDPSAVNRHIAQYGGRDGYDAREVRRRKHMARVAAMEGIRALKGSLLRTVVRLLKAHHSPDWERLEKKISATVYFAYPYHAWERGSNENTNGLLRQYFPKTLDFNLITAKELAHVVKLLNDRPRKRLKFKSPRRIFQEK